jgi:hypothetical protein
MSEHAKEPWRAECDADNPSGSQWAIKDAIGFFIADCHDNAGHDKRVSYGEPNARRIVACVNACVGISTESLEQIKPLHIVVQDDRRALAQQRDELLAALNGFALARATK